MLFSSLTFLYIYIPLLCFLYFIINNSVYKRVILTIFSVLFYAWGEPVFVLLILGSVFVNYISGILINRAENNPVLRKTYLTISIILNLSILAIFKYTPMAIETVNSIVGLEIPIPNITMPIGISFYTFQAMSYVIDVYRKDTEVQKSYFDLLLYITLFPQLIAGPIVRYKDIALQIPQRSVDIEKINQGIFRFCIGLAKKVVIANSCGSVCKALLESVENRAVTGLWVGMVFFSLQIYFDFSGYSDMAIGLGRIFGFEFKENFNYPYLSKSATEFWRRWHISLGTFFRDYIYIPLGGNRKFWLRNVLVVWFLTGLWHGASWNFVLWGLFYGIILIIEKKIIFPAIKENTNAITSVISYIAMFFVTLFGWTIFYFTDFTELKTVLCGMIGLGNLPITDVFANSIINENIFLLALAVIAAFPIFPKICNAVIEKLKINEGIVIYIKMAYSTVLLLISTAMLASGSYNPFLYFRF